MKINARNRVLALLLTLAMLLPNLTGLVPAAQAAELTTGTATVYDLYDLTGETTKTIYGRVQTGTWDQKIGTVAEAHKGNVAFTAKMTVGSEYEHIFIGLGMTGANASSTTDGYIFEIQAKVGEPDAVVYHKKGANWQASSQGLEFDFNGTYVLEAGVVDLYENGALVGKRAYLKANGQDVCHWDDTGSPVTTENLSTTVGIYNEQNNITLESTYSSGYGTANVYDIYDLTGVTSTSVAAWSPAKLGTLADADKEQAAIKFNMNITDDRHRYRFAVGNTGNGSEWDPQGYSVEIAVQFDGNNHVKFLRNANQIAIFNDISGVIGEHDYEFGYRNITFGSNVIGKQVYLSVDGVDLYTYEDNSGYLTGNALGTTVSFNQIDDAGAVTLNSTYENSYGTVNVYDIADLTGSGNNTVSGTENGAWFGTVLGNVDSAKKENVALKTKVTMDTSTLRSGQTDLFHLSLSASANGDGSYFDCSGYALRVYTDNGGNWYYELKKSNATVDTSSAVTADVINTTQLLELGYHDIKLGDHVIGKRVYLKKDGAELLSYEDTTNYLTGSSLTTAVAAAGYCKTVQMDTANETTYGEVTTYDIYDLTGSSENYYYGTTGSAAGGHDEWSGTTIANVSAGSKENVSFKATVTKTAGNQARLSLGALDTANAVDCAGYALRIDDSYVNICRNDQALYTITSVDMTGTYVLEFSFQSILVNGEVTGKRLTVKKDGTVIGTYDDLSGFLTGDTLGTKIAVFTYGNGIQMDTTYTNGYGEATVYDIYDLDGSTSKVLATVDGWADGTLVGHIDEQHKENVALRTKITTSEGGHYRLSLSALDALTTVDVAGYGFDLDLNAKTLYIQRRSAVGNPTTLLHKTLTAEETAELTGTWTLEFGYKSIIEKNSIVGKRVYLMKNGVELASCEDRDGYLTGDTLGTKIAVFPYGKTVQMDTTYETSYGEVTVYDISDLTGSNSTTVNGALNGDWAGIALGSVDAEKKENVALKTNLTVSNLSLQPNTQDLVRLSLSASASDFLNCSGYSMRIYTDNSGNWYYGINKNGNGGQKANSVAMTGDEILGTYELEFGYRDIIFNGNKIGKQVYLKKGGEVIVSYDDTSDYLTGNSLTTTVSAWGYCASFNLDTTLPVSFVHGYNLTLGGRTVINLYLNPEIIGDPSATITVKIEGEKATQTYNLQDLPTNADGYRIVNVKLASGQMNDAVTVTAIPGSGEPMSKVYSVAGYVKYVLGENYSEDLKQLARDLLHYGAAAQKYFDYNADSEENLANNGITDTEDNDLSEIEAEKSVEGSVDGVAIYGASLILRDDTTLRYYLNITGDVNDYTFSINGEEAAPRKVSGTGANYSVQYDGILPNRLGDVYTLIISKGSDTMTVNYSPTIYMKNIFGKGGEAQNLAQELYDYYMSAKAYAGSKQIDTPIVLDLYQITDEKSVTVPANQPIHLGMLMDTDDGLVKTELTSNMAIRFKYTGGDGIRIQFGATGKDLNYTSGALFMSVPPLSSDYSVGSFGIANPADDGTWMTGNSYVQDTYLYKGQDSYIELGCVKVYTDGIYTHDRYYIRAAASLEALDALAANGTFSAYYDTTMKSNNGVGVIVRSRMDTSAGDILATTWTDAEAQAYDASLKSAAQNATSSDYDKLAEKYPDTVDTSNAAESLATAKKPTGSITPNDGGELILWAESGASKIVQDDDGKAATQADQKKTLSIQMAKNESEGAQLMLFGNRNVESYEIFVTDLVTDSNDVITADNIRLYQLKYLTVDGKYDDLVEEPEWWEINKTKVETYVTPDEYKGEKLPDAMLPFAKAVEYGENVILAGNNQAIYVDVSTSSADAAGTYEGTIVVKTNTDHVYILDISVVVRDVVMPDTSKLGSYAPYLGRDAFSSGELDGSDEMAALYTQTLESFNMSSIAPASDGVMNLEKFLVSVRGSYDSTTNYMLPVDNNDSYYTVGGVNTLVYCNYALLKEYVVALAKMSIADGKNYLDKAFFYPSDHVDEAMTADDFALAQATYAAFRQVLADANAELSAIYEGTGMYTTEIANSVNNLRFLLTIPGDDSEGRSLSIGALMDTYFPQTDAANKNVVFCTTNEVLVRPEFGDAIDTAIGDRELWTYLCLKPFYPHSNYAFDTPVVGLRTLGWTCYQENVDTLMTWKSVNYLYDAGGLSLDRWTTSTSGVEYYTPGDGNIFYPGAKYGIDGPCPSLRAVAWRDGVDDYNLMSAVVENGGSAANLNTLYGLITEETTDSIKVSEGNSIWGTLVKKTVDSTHPLYDDAKFIIVRNALLQMAASNASEHAAIVANAQTAVNGVTAATGTINAEESPASESTATITGNIYTDGYYQLADFETYEETVQNKFMGNAQLALSDLTQDGGYSLQVAVQPGQDGETVWIPTTSKYFSATTNFSSASKVTFKVYNAQGAGSTVRFYLNTFDRSTDEDGLYGAGTYLKGNADLWHDDHPNDTSLRFTLEHGWNEITINKADIGVDWSHIGAFIIAFDSGVGCDAQQVYYLDDVRVYMNKVS